MAFREPDGALATFSIVTDSGVGARQVSRPEREKARARLRSLAQSIRELPVFPSEDRQQMAGEIEAAGEVILNSRIYERARATGRLNCHERDQADMVELLPELTCFLCGERRQRARVSWEIPLHAPPMVLNIGNVPGYQCEGCGPAFPWQVGVDLYLHTAAFAALVGDRETAADFGRRALGTRVQTRRRLQAIV